MGILRTVSPTRGLSPEEAAAYWIVRHDNGDMSRNERGEFEAWLDESMTNAAAYERARGVWCAFDDAGEDPHLAALRQSALVAAPAPRYRSWGKAAVAVAACTAAALIYFAQPSSPDAVSTATPMAGQSSGTAILAAAQSTTATAKGGFKVLKLPDGSIVTLNTDSAITIDFAGNVRRIRLTRGQALFAVAKDPARRFVVDAADRQITALGTQFEVRLDPGRMQLLLVEGKVAIERASLASSSGPASATILKPGQELIAELGSAQLVRAAEVNDRLLWVDGYVEFNDEPLGRAVAEVNRYTDRPIVLNDAAVASMRLSGVFRTGDPNRFAAIVSELLPVTTRPGASGGVEIVARHES